MMIKSKTIQSAMVEMSANTFHHNMRKYVEICAVEVRDIIKFGVKGHFEKFVAWVLKLKKYIPDGWTPEPLAIKPIRRIQLSLPLSAKIKDRVYGISQLPSGRWRATIYHGRVLKSVGTFNTPQSANSAYNVVARVLGKRENPRLIDVEKQIMKFASQVVVADNSVRMKEIVDLMGGKKVLAKLFRVTDRTVQMWIGTPRNGTKGYFPRRHIKKLVRYAHKNDINIICEELRSFLPTNKGQ